VTLPSSISKFIPELIGSAPAKPPVVNSEMNWCDS
jgi:hypothetical protein